MGLPESTRLSRLSVAKQAIWPIKHNAEVIIRHFNIFIRRPPFVIELI